MPLAKTLTDQAMGPSDPFAGMSPMDALKIRQELAAKQTVTPEQASANRWTTGKDALSVTPIIGQAMSAYDAGQGAGQAYDAFSQGEVKKGLLASALTALSGIGAVTGLPFGRMAGNAAKAGKDTASAFSAWHGSPHDFDAFDMGKIGTGEKALTRYGSEFADRGYGHYFADERAVGDSYRSMMAGDGGKLYNVSLDVEPNQLLHWDKTMADQSPDVRQALSGVSGNFDDAMTGGDIFKALERQANGQPQEASRVLREAGIPGTRYPASQNPSRYATYQGGAVPSGEGDSAINTAVTFLDKAQGDVNKAMQDVVATADRVGWSDANLNGVLNHLASGDIALDQLPRKHNYVVFDDALIKILSKE